uniref:Uncharacterized protein n=1 Tax=Branchiostoma floridae TaxID=7739 RepID=C3XSL0_BRAFL|eukprot:XP_002612922.1 hypothetical protein BRAFLDRAFT_127267 [Branchiostoma floridae]
MTREPEARYPRAPSQDEQRGRCLKNTLSAAACLRMFRHMPATLQVPIIVQCTVCQGKAVIPAATRKHVVIATSASPGSLAGTPVVSRRIAKATRKLVSTPQSHSSPYPSTPGLSMKVAGSSPATPGSSLRDRSLSPGSSSRKGKHQKQRHAQLKHMLSQQSLGDTSTSLSDFLQSL